MVTRPAPVATEAPAPAPAPDAAAGPGGDDELDQLLAQRSVVIVVGPGGVGKTTLAASLALRAAERHGRRVLVVTVDPARRLAQTLGVEGVPAEPILVPARSGERGGRLWALMIDMSRSWDELVRRHGPGGADTEALLANPLYRSLTTRFIQSHDYIALDLMCDLADGGRYDLVVIDTPPSSHAIDVLDAPGRLVEFFDSRFLRFLIAPYSSRVAQVTARPFLAVAERLLGAGFLAGIAELFWRFAQLRPGLVARARQVQRRLDDPATAYVVVTTAEPAALASAEQLIDALAERGHQPAVVLHNRALPAGAEPGAAAGVEDPSLAAAVADLTRADRDLAGRWVARPLTASRVRAVPWRGAPLATLDDLRSLLG